MSEFEYVCTVCRSKLYNVFQPIQKKLNTNEFNQKQTCSKRKIIKRINDCKYNSWKITTHCCYGTELAYHVYINNNPNNIMCCIDKLLRFLYNVLKLVQPKWYILSKTTDFNKTSISNIVFKAIPLSVSRHIPIPTTNYILNTNDLTIERDNINMTSTFNINGTIIIHNPRQRKRIIEKLATLAETNKILIITKKLLLYQFPQNSNNIKVKSLQYLCSFKLKIEYEKMICRSKLITLNSISKFHVIQELQRLCKKFDSEFDVWSTDFDYIILDSSIPVSISPEESRMICSLSSKKKIILLDKNPLLSVKKFMQIIFPFLLGIRSYTSFIDPYTYPRCLETILKAVVQDVSSIISYNQIPKLYLCENPQTQSRKLKDINKIPIVKNIFYNSDTTILKKTILKKEHHEFEEGQILSLKNRNKKCPVCIERSCNSIIIPCYHLMCDTCIQTIMSRKIKCPICRSSITSVYSLNPVPINSKNKQLLTILKKSKVSIIVCDISSIRRRLLDFLNFMAIRCHLLTSKKNSEEYENIVKSNLLPGGTTVFLTSFNEVTGLSLKNIPNIIIYHPTIIDNQFICGTIQYLYEYTVTETSSNKINIHRLIYEGLEQKFC